MLCPRACGADRERERGFCGAGKNPNIARAALHFWEEPALSGTRGSGAIFFCGCNMDCLFCQNNAVNHAIIGREADAFGLAQIMLALESRGAHNVNLVSPAPFAKVLLEAIPRAREEGLNIPIVYNTNAYEKVETLRALSGLIDVYLPDLKYVSPRVAGRYGAAADYFRFAAPAVAEMFAQRGLLETDAAGLAVRGVIIRHLVLPGCVDETRRVIDHIAANYPKEIAFSLMGQYVPNGTALPPPLDRRLMRREYERAIDYALQRGLVNALIQEPGAATLAYTPEFDGSIIEPAPLAHDAAKGGPNYERDIK